MGQLDSVGNMEKYLVRTQSYLEPLVGIIFLLTWAIAETGHHQIVPGASLRSVLPWWATLTLVCGAMALARIRPIVAMALSTVVVLAQLILPYSAGFTGGTDWPIYFGFLLVIFGVSASVQRRWRRVSFAFAIGLAVAVSGLLIGWGRLDSAGPLPVVGVDVGAMIINRVLIFLVAIMLSLAIWFFGFSARLWQQKLSAYARLADTTAELNRVEVDLLISRERDQIAQEVHDIMAHSLSVIIAQADGARFAAEDRPEAVRASLSNIADSARASLTDVRMLIESLATGPIGLSNPGLAELDELMDRMRSAGLDVTVERFGDPDDFTAAQELAVYRIVQESLTNALKHADVDAEARIALDWRGPGLAIAVTSQGASRNDNSAPAKLSRSGRGLHGMRERAQLAGGWLRAGFDDEEPNTFIVTAFLPSTMCSVVS